MRHDPQESFADAAAKCLNRLMLALLPDSRKAWGHALIAEQHAIAKGRERLTWAAGGILMTVNEFVRTLFSDRPTWAVGLTLGITSALIDLRSSTRWPYVVLLCTSGASLGILAAEMGMALAPSARFEFALGRASDQQLGCICSRSLRCVLWSGPVSPGRHIRVVATEAASLVPARNCWSLKAFARPAD